VTRELTAEEHLADIAWELERIRKLLEHYIDLRGHDADGDECWVCERVGLR
jgi:hypothetical protein